MIKSRRMRLAGHVARTGEKRNIYGILVGKSEGKRPLGRPTRALVGNIKMDLNRNGVVWTGFIWLRIGKPVEGSCDQGNEPSGSIKCWEVLE
jgi:hypothetical protein